MVALGTTAHPSGPVLRAGPGLLRIRPSAMQVPVRCVPDFQKVTVSLGRQGTEESGAREACIVHKNS